jgi:biotin transport system substrate-specific component
MGAAGLPVFTPLGTPGVARLFGPTGGYLLAYPLAAAVVGLIAARAATIVGCAGAALGGLAVIHAGGVTQLLAITGSAGTAIAAGLLPFLAKDLATVLVAALLLRRFGRSTRALR